MLNRTITNLKVALDLIANVDPIRPIEMVTAPEVRLIPKHHYAYEYMAIDPHTGCYVESVRVGIAKNLDVVGWGEVGRFESFMEADSEDHLEPAIEYLDGPWGVPFHDVINQANVY